MLIISCREGFWSNDDFVDGPDQIADVNLGNPDDGSPPVSRDEFSDRISGQSVLLLVHGFNNPRDAVIGEYESIDENQRKWIGYHDVVIGYTWPGSIGANEAFIRARDRVPGVVPRFGRVLRLLDEGAKTIHVMSHSTGCHISLETYSEIGRELRKHEDHRQFLMAAAVGKASIERNGEYFAGSDFGRSCHVLFNIRDFVLSGMFRDLTEENALGAYGPRREGGGISVDLSERVYALDCQNVLTGGHGHSGYKQTPEVYEYIKNVVNDMDVDRWMDFPEEIDDGP